MSKPVAADIALSSRKEGKIVSQLSAASSTGRKRPERGPASSLYANFRSALLSICVYRLRSFLTISGSIIGTLVAMLAFTLMLSMHTLPEAALSMRVTTIAFIGSACVSCLAAGLACMNSMLVSVTERTHEISVRIVVGARRRDIYYQILLEALLLCSSGAVLGTLLALLSSFVLTALLSLPFIVDPILLLVIFSVVVVTGVIGGIYPALRASRLDPGETWRMS